MHPHFDGIQWLSCITTTDRTNGRRENVPRNGTRIGDTAGCGGDGIVGHGLGVVGWMDGRERKMTGYWKITIDFQETFGQWSIECFEVSVQLLLLLLLLLMMTMTMLTFAPIEIAGSNGCIVPEVL